MRLSELYIPSYSILENPEAAVRECFFRFKQYNQLEFSQDAEDLFEELVTTIVQECVKEHKEELEEQTCAAQDELQQRKEALEAKVAELDRVLETRQKELAQDPVLVRRKA